MQEWASSMDSAEYVGVVFFDIKKAFDRVWHDGLLHKLSSLGVDGHALDWFRSFLSGRRQRVAVGSSVSGIASLEAGVRQGGILLFIAYMNDIVNATSANTNLFADDTSTFVGDKSPTSLQSRLQTAVSELEAWFSKWALTVNTLKSALMFFQLGARVSLSLMSGSATQQYCKWSAISTWEYFYTVIYLGRSTCAMLLEKHLRRLVSFGIFVRPLTHL